VEPTMKRPQMRGGGYIGNQMGKKTIIRVRENKKAAERQEKIFTDWVNFILKKRGLRISSVLKDLEDGLILIQLAELLTGKKVPAYERNPRMMAQQLSNITIALKFFEEHNVKFTIGPKSIASNDEKTILGFIWALIRKFQLKSAETTTGRLTSARDEDLDVLEKVMAEAVEADSSARQERPKMKDGTHSSVMSETVRGSRITFAPAKVEDVCSKCELPIKDATMIQIETGVCYHFSCFTCSTCSVPFEDTYWEHDDMALCEEHYLEVAGKKCAKCSNYIHGPLVLAMHQNWHQACFVCTTCNKPFEGDYFIISGEPYCKQDYYRKRGWLCAKCDKAVGKGDKSALGKAWHKGCFVCTQCESPFGTEGFYNIQGQPFCPLHYRAQKASGQ